MTSSHEVCEEVGFGMAQLHIHWSGRGPGNISVNVHLVLFEIWADDNIQSNVDKSIWKSLRLSFSSRISSDN